MHTQTKVHSYNLIPSVWYIHDKPVLMENYFNDIYHLFLNKLVRITHDSTLTQEEQLKLESLFQEVLKVKSLLQKEG